MLRYRPPACLSAASNTKSRALRRPTPRLARREAPAVSGNGNGTDQPLEIVIGDPTTPLRKQFAPTIQLDHIYNSVVDPTASSQEGLGPQTSPSVNIVVNGNIHALNIASATAQTVTGGYQFSFPLVDITGRTAVRARALAGDIGVDRGDPGLGDGRIGHRGRPLSRGGKGLTPPPD